MYFQLINTDKPSFDSCVLMRLLQYDTIFKPNAAFYWNADTGGNVMCFGKLTDTNDTELFRRLKLLSDFFKHTCTWRVIDCVDDGNFTIMNGHVLMGGLYLQMIWYSTKHITESVASITSYLSKCATLPPKIVTFGRKSKKQKLDLGHPMNLIEYRLFQLY
jgi:hypothetical protein